jgi:hypothetical protein
MHLKDWWWLQDVFGLAQVLALVGVGVAVFQLRQQLRTQVRIKVRPGHKGSTAEVSIRNSAFIDPPLIRKLWAVPELEATRHHDAPENAHDPNVFAYFNADTPLGTIKVPSGRYVVIAQTQSGARFYSDVRRS